MKRNKLKTVHTVYTDGYSCSVVYERGKLDPAENDIYLSNSTEQTGSKKNKENPVQNNVNSMITDKKNDKQQKAITKIDHSKEKLIGIDPGHRFIITGVTNQVNMFYFDMMLEILFYIK